MPIASVCRKILLILLVTVLVTPWVSAAGPQPVSPRSAQAVEPAPLELFNRLWNFLRGTGSKAGCGIDTNGRCYSQQPRPLTKEGCGIDTNGHCLP